MRVRNHRARTPRWLRLALLGAGLWTAAAAGFAQPVASFDPKDEPVPGSIRLAADPLAPAGRELELSLVADEVTDLYGVSFTVRYPNRLVRLDEADVEIGGFLSEDGAVLTTELLTKRGSRFLIVGISRVGPEPGVSGSGTLLTLRFRARDNARGRGKLLLMENDAVDSAGEIVDLVWQEGAIEVR